MSNVEFNDKSGMPREDREIQEVIEVFTKELVTMELARIDSRFIKVTILFPTVVSALKEVLSVREWMRTQTNKAVHVDQKDCG